MKTGRLRVAAAVVGVLGVVLLLLVGAGLALARHKMERRIDLQLPPLALRSDVTSLERGRYLFASRGCADCHGSTGAGRMFLDDGKGMRIAGANLTSGPGSEVTGYQAVDWARSIRHGINPQGRPLMIMPSEDYNRLTDEDLASIVAYIRSLPPMPGPGTVVELPLPVKLLYGFGLVKDAAERIDHRIPPQAPVPEGVTLAHGEYVANMCIGCHGADLAGGRIPGSPPDWPSAANLTPGEGTVMGVYADADGLIRMFRTGLRPDGSVVQVMPFASLREMSEIDLRALHLYLTRLPPRPHG